MTAPAAVPPELTSASWYVIGVVWPDVTVTPAPGVGSDLTTVTDAEVTTGLATVFVAHVGAPQPGVLTFVYVALFEMVEPLASPESTVTWNPKPL